MKTAIKTTELNALLDKYRRGNWVLWDDLAADAQQYVCLFRGVGRINNAAAIAAIGRKNITSATRYPHTKDELAAIFGITRQTLDRWENSELVILKTTNKNRRCSWAYDAKDLLKQIEGYAKSYKKE